MATTNTNTLSQTASLARILVLFAVCIFHFGLVFRFRLVQLFPSEWVGYTFIGLVFFIISTALFLVIRPEIRAIHLPLPNIVNSDIFQATLKISATLVILLGIIWRYQVYAGTQLQASMGDMLPLIKLACDTFLSGEFPYKLYELPWQVPLTYMPGLWMIYIPSQYFEFDLRNLGLFLCAVSMLLLFAASFRKNDKPEVFIAGWIVLAGFCLSPAIARFSINGHTYPLWLYFSIFCFCLLNKYYKIAALSFGLVLATRQTSLVYLPFVLVFFWREGGCRTLITGFTLMAFTCGAMCLPFTIIDAKAFLLDPLEAYRHMAEWDFQQGEHSYASKTIGFAYSIKTFGLLMDLSWPRYLVLLALPFIAWRTVSDTFSLLTAMGTAGILFALLAPVAWYYIYVPPILLLSFAALSNIDSKPIE